MPLVKHYHVTYVGDDDKPLKITFQNFDGFIRCSGKSGKLLYITILHSGISTLGLYPEYINPQIFFLSILV